MEAFFLFLCWGTRTRTRKGRTRICSVTITPYPNVIANLDLRVQRYYFFINYQNFWAKIYKKPQNFRFSFVIRRFISTFVLQITHYYI